MPFIKKTTNKIQSVQTGGDFNNPSPVLKDVLKIVTAAEETSKVVGTGFQYTVGINSLEVYVNGQLLRVKETILGTVYGDYTETTNFTVTFEPGVIHNGDQVRFRVTANSYDYSNSNRNNIEQLSRTVYGRESSDMLKGSAIGYGVTEVNALAYGQELNDVTLQAAIDGIGSLERTLVLSVGTWDLEADVIVPANICLRVPNGAIFSIDTGITLTINGPFEAGLYQVFNGDGSVIYGVDSIEKILPEWRGAKSDNLTDNYTSLTKTFSDAFGSKTANFSPIVFLKEGIYLTSDSIICLSNINVIMEGELKYSGTDNIIIFSYGESTSSSAMVNLKLNVTRSINSDWSSENSVSIRLIRLYNSKVEITRASNSTIGLQLYTNSSSSAIAYNTFVLNYLLNNKIAIDICGVTNGWCNENLFLGGRIGCDSNVNAGKGRYGLVVRSDTFYNHNNNLFIKLSIETGPSWKTGIAYTTDSYVIDSYLYKCLSNHTSSGTFANELSMGLWQLLSPWVSGNPYVVGDFISPGYVCTTNHTSSNFATDYSSGYWEDKRSLAIDFRSGSMNTILKGRTEFTASIAVRTMNNSYLNNVEFGYGDSVEIENLGLYLGARCISHRRDKMFFDAKVKVFDSGFLPDKTVVSKSGVKLYTHISGVHQRTSFNGTLYSVIENGITKTDDYLNYSVSYGLGIRVDTSKAKQFYVFMSLVDTSISNTNLMIKCYDINGVLLTNTGAYHPYGKTLDTGNFFIWTSTWGGAYYTVISATGCGFILNEQVKFVDIILAGKTGFSLKGFSISADSPTHTWTGYTEGNGANIAYASPSNGVAKKGQIAYHANPVSGSPMGWICTQRLDTTVKTTVSTGTTVDININTSNLLANDVIGIVLDSGSIHWSTVASITDVDTIEIVDSIASQATAGNIIYTIRWNAMSNLA